MPRIVRHEKRLFMIRRMLFMLASALAWNATPA